MDKFTKEQQVQAVYDLKVGYTLGHADIAMLKSMARQLLASMEQEPMAWVTMQKEFCDDERTAITNRVDADRYSISCYDLTPLYAAPQLPHPAVPDEIDVNDPVLDTHRKWMAEGWNRCRAAMLQGSQPVSKREQVRREHAEWSDKTFGDVGPVGPLKHLSKEALEAAAEPDDLSEWADMHFLLWDAQRRAGISDGEITAAMEEKLKVNMARQWPEPKDGEPRLHIKEQSEQEKK